MKRSQGSVDFEIFRSELEAALCYSDRTKDGRPPFDPVMMLLKILVIQAHNNLSDGRIEFLIDDRLSFTRFPGPRPRGQAAQPPRWAVAAPWPA